MYTRREERIDDKINVDQENAEKARKKKEKKKEKDCGK